MNRKFTKWSFPVVVRYDEISEYSLMLKKVEERENVLFDLSETKRINSSFIGFLIHAKEYIENRNNGQLHLKFSDSIERIVALLGLTAHFCVNTGINPDIKSA